MSRGAAGRHVASEPARAPWLHAHRGASADAPENTLAAFRLGLEQGADGIELDVHLSADRVPVVIHDPTLDRTTDRTGAVRELPVTEITTANAGARWPRPSSDALSWTPSEVRVPTLADILAWLPVDRGVVVDIKDPHATPAVMRLLEVRANAAVMVKVISFDQDAIDQARRLVPSIPTGLLLDEGDDLDAGIARAAAAGHSAIVPFEGDLGRDPAEAVHRAADAGLATGCYVVNDRGRAAQLHAAGVAFLMTDVPALVRPTGDH